MSSSSSSAASRRIASSTWSNEVINVQYVFINYKLDNNIHQCVCAYTTLRTTLCPYRPAAPRAVAWPLPYRAATRERTKREQTPTARHAAKTHAPAQRSPNISDIKTMSKNKMRKILQWHFKHTHAQEHPHATKRRRLIMRRASHAPAQRSPNTSDKNTMGKNKMRESY